MKKYVLILLCVILAYSCTESDFGAPNNRETEYQISITGDSVILSTGSVYKIGVIISPTANELDLNSIEGNCSIVLRFINSNVEPKNYKLAKIEKDSNILGGYIAYIEDLCQKNNYDDQVNMVIRERGGGKVYMSPPFIVKHKCDSLNKSLLDTGLPLVNIETINHETPTCDYVSPPFGCWGAGITNTTKVPGSLEIMKDSNIIYFSGIYEKEKSGMTIKIRGNTSAYSEKKPYKIKLEKKADLLNRNSNDIYKDKEWLLLRYNGLNTPVGFKVNELIKMQWTPAFQFVNVVINGDYRGLYMLTESVKRNPECRLNVDKTGYILEYDAYWWNENVYFVNDYAYSMNYTFKYPEDDEITQEQIDYIKSYIDSLEVKIKNGEEYEQYIDIDSWVRWVLAHDILGTEDAGGSNVFMTKSDNSISSKLMMANLWDFDSNYRMQNTWSAEHTTPYFYYDGLLNNKNTLFKNGYKSIWREIYPTLFHKIEDFLISFEESELSFFIDRSIILDNIRWNEKKASIYNDISNSRSWFRSRQQFLNDNIPNL